MSIMVPLDTSELARSAIPLATDLAQGLGEELLLVTVADPQTRHSVGAFAYAEGQEPTDMLEAGLRTIADNLDDGVGAQVELLAGQAAEALVGRADRDDVSMVVMTSHGRTGYARWRMGSVADRVVRGATVPVTVIPAPWRQELREKPRRSRTGSGQN